MAFGIQIGSPNDALQKAKRFQLPQFSSPSGQINQANSDVIQSGTQVPSGDIYSGAKQGVEKIKTAIPMDTQNPNASPSFNRAAEMVNDANDLATEPAPQQDTPETQVGRPQTGIKTALPKSQGLTNEAARAARGAMNPTSQDLDALRQASIKQAEAQTALGNFDPTKQPVSKMRKAAGIASGIVTGVLGHGGIEGGIKSYENVTRRPALEKQQQLARQAQAAGVNVGTAEKTAQAADKLANTQNDISKNLEDVAKTTQGEEIYNDTGRGKAIAETGLANANARNANAEADVRNRPPEPKITNVPENDSAFKTTYDKATNTWNIDTLQKTGEKGIQKLSAGDEPVVRGWLATKGHDPNATLEGYKNGDPKSSALVYQALHDEAISRNPGMMFDSAQLIPTYGPTGDATGAILFDPRSRKMTPVTTEEMGLGGGTFKTPPKPLDQTSNGQYKGAINTQKVVDGSDGVIEKLYPSSKDPAVQEKARQLREQLGPLAGRISDAGVDLAGISNPEIAGLLQELQSAAIFAASSHSGRITPAFIEEFKKSMGGVKQAPENLKSRLKIISEVANDVRGTIEDTNPNATQVAAQKILEQRQKNEQVQKHKVGDVVIINNKQHKITKLHDDGSFDADEVKK